VAIFDVVLRSYDEWVHVVIHQHLRDPFLRQYTAYSIAEDQLADRHDGCGGDDGMVVDSDQCSSELPHDDGIRNGFDECWAHWPPLIEH